MDEKRLVPLTADIFIKEDGTVIFADLPEELERTAKELGEFIDGDHE